MDCRPRETGFTVAKGDSNSPPLAACPGPPGGRGPGGEVVRHAALSGAHDHEREVRRVEVGTGDSLDIRGCHQAQPRDIFRE